MEVHTCMCFKPTWNHAKTTIKVCLNVLFSGHFQFRTVAYLSSLSVFQKKIETSCIKFWIAV